VAQLTNRSPLGFKAQTKKPSRWFWGPNHQTKVAGFEAQTGKSSTTLVLRLKQETHHQFWGQTGRNRRHQFWGQSGETIAAGFEAKPLETVASGFEAKPSKTVIVGFEAKPPKTVAAGFEVKPVKTVRVVLRPNHSQIIAISFEVQTDEKSSQLFWG
jgi:hypothetical protein